MRASWRFFLCPGGRLFRQNRGDTASVAPGQTLLPLLVFPPPEFNSAGNKTQEKPPRHTWLNFFARKEFFPPERSNPAEQKQRRLCRNGDLARSLHRRSFAFRLNEQIAASTLPAWPFAQSLCHHCLFFSPEVDSGGAETKETSPKRRRRSIIWPPSFGAPPE